MGGIFADRRSELLPDRALVGFGWVGRAHQVTPRLHGAVFLQRHDYTRSARHEFSQAFVEWFAAMNFIEAFGLLAGLMNHLQGANAETAANDSIDNLTGIARTNC